MICYVLAMGKQHLGPHVVVGYGIKIFWPGLFITSPDHLVEDRQLLKGLYAIELELARAASVSLGPDRKNGVFGVLPTRKMLRTLS